ncbi:Hyaluronan synthase [Phocoenobacter uteri]|uniref:Hyaluronan synthase n=1 Tax=Phocoenobacter uteri TaxID=146806 RepID=A0A379CCC4_9PAST|nr:glycosyltransferase family A protein [Phocoenobacter uteri]MDG6881292.1 hypothetical protein [Phocoenobacter uteri]SUB59317.1 Hyaluronan synthase [Phocoenobacter uteri]
MFQTLLLEYDSTISVETVIAHFALQKENAKHNLETLMSKKISYKNYCVLIRYLSFYAPSVALELLKSKQLKEPYFYLSLLAHLGKHAELEKEIKSQLNADSSSEVLLLKNYLHNDAKQKIIQLNTLFKENELELLQLKDKNKNLFVDNLYSTATPLPKEDMPLVSIIVTTYNLEKYIEHSIKSLLNQTYTNIEIIVVDDASSDNTVAIVDKIALKHTNIKLIKQTNNVGTYACKHIAMEYVNGEFVQCHDGDDWACPQKIEKQVIPLLKDRKLVATFSRWLRLDKDGDPVTDRIYPLIRENPSSCLFRKEVVMNKMRLWEQVKTGADSEFNARIKQIFSKQILTIKLPLTIGSYRKESLSQNPNTKDPLGRLKYWEEWKKNLIKKRII